MTGSCNARERLGRVSESFPSLRLLLLFGSRARGEAREASDWDLGYLADEDLDPMELRLRLVEILETERVDLVDLARANGLLRYRAARDVIAVVGGDDGTFRSFRWEAVRFWCDVEAVMQRCYDAVLENLESP